MWSKVLDFFKPPEFESFERAQKAKFLHFSLLILTMACIFLGFFNMPGNTSLDIIIFILGGVSFLCIPLNKQGYFTPTAIFVSTLTLAVLTFSLMDGVGLKDAGLIAYPLYFIYATFLFGKKSSPLITLLSIGSVFFVYVLDRRGYLSPAEYSNESQLTVIVILFVVTGLFLWVVMENWEKIMQNLIETYDLTLSGWGKTLEYRDRETEGHSLRVTDITMELAKRMGVSKSKLNQIRRGALLHDIGKIAVPDSILRKKGSLTEEEWQVVKMHPVYAKNLLIDIPYLKPALDIPYHHHERWDGSGYPDGLAGDDIPLAARLFAVVDVWDALISDRPYRKAWTNDQTRTYLQEQSGQLFDPQIIQVFLELLDQGLL